MKKRALSAGLLVFSLCLPSAARAQSAPSAPVTGPSSDWRWSAFVSDVFDGERAAGLRWRMGASGALFVSGSYDREQRDFGDPVTTRARYGFAAGYRRLLGGGRLKALLELEGRITRETIDSDESGVSGTRDGVGGGGYAGFEYFFSPSLSLGARVGVAYENRDEAGGGQTSQITAFKPGLFLSAYW